jgi:SWI/SNF related-matrix-associated actin-dependent regulator of chromatin subfamily C
MFSSIEKALISNKCLVLPIVYIRPEVDKATQSKIKETIKKHQGSMAENEDQATHIIYPSCDILEEEYARPLFQREKMVLLHWYYLPDSYDSWVAADLPVEPPDSPQSKTGPWRVSFKESANQSLRPNIKPNPQVNSSWLNELDEYNEWMCEEDYEVDESGKKKVHKVLQLEIKI